MLIFNNLEQGSEEWLKLRMGIPTTSSFGSIITPEGKASKSMQDYSDKLLAELLFGYSEPYFQTYAMQRGTELEPQAVAYYESIKKVKAKEVGFITTTDGRIGCSPDRLIGDKGLLEVKCPMEKQHTKNLISGEIDKKYIPQVMGQMWVSKREWCDWMSYHPDAPASIVRVERDEEYIGKLEEVMNDFLDLIDNKVDVLKTKGIPFKIELKEREDAA